MRLLRPATMPIALILGVLMATPMSAEVRFNLRGYVSAICSIEEQRAASDGLATLLELQINCNLSEFSLSAPEGARITLGDYQLVGDGASPVVTPDGSQIAFAGLEPGRHQVQLRITGAGPLAQLSLAAR